MAEFDRSIVPDQHRETVESALGAAFGPGDVSALHVVTGGASGALTYRVESATGPHLLRVDTLVGGPLRNPHQYDCMRTAAEAGIAPPLRHLDADAGVVVMPFLPVQPLADFPGGPPALAAAAAALLARLHDTPTFPSHGDHLDNLARLLGFLDQSGRVAPGLLDRHAAAFERIRAAYPWRPEMFVSGHNDPNEFNLLFDGDRLWLIDWETASRNDPFIDLATVSSYLAPTPGLRDVVLRSWLGHEPDELDRARLTLMGRIRQLFVGCILLTIVVDPARPVHDDLTALSADELGAAVQRGDLHVGEPAAAHAYAKLALSHFLGDITTPEFEHALEVAAAG